MRFGTRKLRAFGTVIAGLVLSVGLVGAPGPAAATSGADPSHWKTWVLQSADQFRLPAPPASNSDSTLRDLARLEALQAKRTPKIRAMVHRYSTGPATVPWTKLSLQMILDHRFGPFPTRSERAYALLHIAMYDALVAAWDSHDAYNRPRPAKVDPYIHPLLSEHGSSYPDERSTIAGAAERVLEYLFPGEPVKTFTGLAHKITSSRLYAGVNYPSDVAASLKLGKDVADAVIAFGAADGSQVKWDGSGRACSTTDCGGTGSPSQDCNSYPAEEEAQWIPTQPVCQFPPTDPMVAHWKTWLLSSPDQMLSTIPEPPAYGSQQFLDELQVVHDAWDGADQARQQAVYFWDDGPGTYSPGGHWNAIALQFVKAHHAGTWETARLFAAMNTAEWDAFVAAWNTKYHYWSMRPITAIHRQTILGQPNPVYDPNWLPALITPPFPSYISGHATVSGAASRVLQWFFPDPGQDRNAIRDSVDGATGSIDSLADQVADSRLVAGIHYPSDNAMGERVGREIAQLAIQRLETDGSQ